MSAFKIKEYETLPVTPLGRAAADPYGFPWGDMKPGKAGLEVDLAFFKERGLADDKLTFTNLKDIMRRTFYGWKDTKEHKDARKNLAVAFREIKDTEGKMVAIEAFLGTANGVAEVKPTAEATTEQPAPAPEQPAPAPEQAPVEQPARAPVETPKGNKKKAA